LVEGRVVGLEAFGDEKLLKRNYEGLLSGIAIEATDDEFCKEIRSNKIVTVDDFLKGILGAKKERYRSVGHGSDMRFEADGFVGCGLVADRKVLHLEAFAV